ncbi:MAG TPA: hypothetical protein VFI95_03710 [Terriglobales bacterium]|nr:hypothetical protein [Terriglobales bacterium]
MTGVAGKVKVSQWHADLPQEVVGWSAAGKDADIIVGNFLARAADVENDGILAEFDRSRVENR